MVVIPNCIYRKFNSSHRTIKGGFMLTQFLNVPSFYQAWGCCSAILFLIIYQQGL